MNLVNSLKLAMANQSLVRADIQSIESKTGCTILPTQDPDQDVDYYPQVAQGIRQEAASMATHYEVFYCVEKSIRSLVTEKMVAEKGNNWWVDSVPEAVRVSAERNRQRELESGFTTRSDRLIDYTTFGELGEIVRANWAVFADIFSSLKGFERVMASLNLLRGPIAHCSPLAADEVDRLRLTLRDWFRLMS